MGDKSKKEGPFGNFQDELLHDIHNQSAADIVKSLTKSAIKPSKKRRDKEKEKEEARDKRRKEKILTEEKEKERMLRRAARKEQKRAEELLGLLNLKNVPPALKVKFTKALHEQHQDLFKFLMTTIAPVELSLEPAIADATEALKMITGSQDVEIATTRMRSILNDLMDLKMLAYLSRRLRLGDELRQKIIDKHFAQVSGQGSKSNDILRQLLASKMSDSPITNRKPALAAKSIPVRTRPTRD